MDKVLLCLLLQLHIGHVRVCHRCVLFCVRPLTYFVFPLFLFVHEACPCVVVAVTLTPQGSRARSVCDKHMSAVNVRVRARLLQLPPFACVTLYFVLLREQAAAPCPCQSRL